MVGAQSFNDVLKINLAVEQVYIFNFSARRYDALDGVSKGRNNAVKIRLHGGSVATRLATLCADVNAAAHETSPIKNTRATEKYHIIAAPTVQTVAWLIFSITVFADQRFRYQGVDTQRFPEICAHSGKSLNNVLGTL